MYYAKRILTIFIAAITLICLFSCGRMNRIISDSDQVSGSKISTEPPNSTATTVTPNANNSMPFIRTSLSQEQIESIAYDLVDCFGFYDEQTLNIGKTEAEQFAFYLISYMGFDEIKNNYISNLERLVPPDKTEIIDGMIDGQFVKGLGSAIFGVDFIPKEKYERLIGDPAPFGTVCKSVDDNKGKYHATLDLLDVDGSPFANMVLDLHLTNDGNTRIDYASVSEITAKNTNQDTETSSDDTFHPDLPNIQSVEEYDFNQDGKMELVYTYYQDNLLLKNIYEQDKDNYVLIFQDSMLGNWTNYINYKLEGNLLTVNIVDVDYDIVSILPDRLFCTKEKENNELKLLESYDIVEKDNIPCLCVKLDLCMPIGGGDYGPGYSDYMTHYCELFKLNLYLKYNNSEWDINESNFEVKYNDKSKEAKDPVFRSESYFGDHTIEMGGNVRETIPRLGGKVEDFSDEQLDDYLGSVSVNAVRLDLFEAGEICSFCVSTPEYPSPRGLKVGDSREKVRELYGEPDMGFLSNDDHIVYYVCFGDSTEDMIYNSSREFYVDFEGDTVSDMGIYEFCTD